MVSADLAGSAWNCAPHPPSEPERRRHAVTSSARRTCDRCAVHRGGRRHCRSERSGDGRAPTWQRQADAHADRDGYADPYPDAHAHPDGDADAHADSDRHADADSHSHPDSHPDSDSDTHADADADVDAGRVPRCDGRGGVGTDEHHAGSDMS